MFSTRGEKCTQNFEANRGPKNNVVVLVLKISKKYLRALAPNWLVPFLVLVMGYKKMKTVKIIEETLGRGDLEKLCVDKMKYHTQKKGRKMRACAFNTHKKL